MSAPRNSFRRACHAAVLTLVAALAYPTARAYYPTEHQWPLGNIPITLALGPADRTLSDGNTSWNDVAQRALNDWNHNLGLVKFTSVIGAGFVENRGDNKNSVTFGSTVDGDEFGDETIAVTLLGYPNDTVTSGADVVVNNQFTFDSYDGPLRAPGTSTDIDLHRVLLHEFGHVLGLNHPDAINQNVEAVMNSVISDTDHLTTDDIGGTTYMYGEPELHSVPVTAYGLAVDDGRGKIFVSTPKGSYNKGKLAVVDPYQAKILTLAHAQGFSETLVLSGGSEHLYLALGSVVMDQIDPDTFATTQEFTLGTGLGTYATDAAVLPGAPESVLVSLGGNTAEATQHGASADSADFAIYDNGIPRPEEEFESYDSAGSPIILDESGKHFYAFANSFSGAAKGSITRLSIEPQGVSSTVQAGYLATGDLQGGAEYGDGRLYGSDGSVANLASGTYEAPFTDVQSAGRAYTVEVNAAAGQVYFAVPRESTHLNDDKPTLLVEDIATRSLVGNIALPRYTQVLKIRHWGINGLVICLNEKRMLLIRSNLIAPGPVTGIPQTVTLSAPKLAALDEHGSIKDKIVVTRTDSDFSAALDVPYTVSGTAQSGVDYRPLRGMVTIPAGQATAKIKVVPLGSQFSDGPRTLQIRLAPNTAYRWGATSTATVMLTGD